MMIPDETSRTVDSRRAARLAAFQGLYALETPGADLAVVVGDAQTAEPFAPSASEFIGDLIHGVAAKVDELDGMIAPLLAKGWDMSRIAKTDRCALRLAAYELLYRPEIPPKVTIHEAVGLAKRFGTEESSRFVNGVLGKMLERTPKADWEPPKLEDGGAEIEHLAPTDEGEESPEEEARVEEPVRAGSWVLRTEERESE